MQRIFSCTLAVSISSLGKCLFKSLAHFLVGLFVFLLLSCLSSLYICILTPYQIYGLQIFFPIPLVAFFTLIVSFSVQMLFTVM